MRNWVLKTFKPINDFMNDSDRGAGHGVGYGVFYAFVLLPFGYFPWVLVGLLLVNHVRCAFQELVVEQWKDKSKTPDFWYDSIYRPLQTDIVCLGLVWLPVYLWWAVVVCALLVGIKKADDKPLIWWR
jgi:hypothetical protein